MSGNRGRINRRGVCFGVNIGQIGGRATKMVRIGPRGIAQQTVFVFVDFDQSSWIRETMELAFVSHLVISMTIYSSLCTSSDPLSPASFFPGAASPPSGVNK